MLTRQETWLILACLLLGPASVAFGQAAVDVNPKDSRPNPPVRLDMHGDPLPPRALARLGTLRMRPNSGADSAAWSPDGSLLATACGTVKVWDASTGKEVDRFKGKITGGALEFSADGKVLLAASSDGSVEWWDVNKAEMLRRRKEERQTQIDFFPSGVALFPNLNLFVLTDYYSMGEVRELNTGKRLCRVRAGEGYLTFAVSPDGKIVAWVDDRKQAVILGDASSGRELGQLKGDARLMSSPVFSPDGKMLAAVADEEVVVWDVASRKITRRIKGGGGPPAFSPNGRRLAVRGLDCVLLWDLQTDREALRLQDSAGWHGFFRFSPDGKRLCVVRHGVVEVGVWDAATGNPLLVFEGHKSRVVCLAFSPDGKQLASGGGQGDAALIVWDLATRKTRFRLTDHRFNVCCAAWSPDGKILATGDGMYPHGFDDREAQVRFWDAGDGRLVRQFSGHLNSVFSLSFADDGKTLLSAGGDARAALWELSSGKRLHWLRGAEHFKRAAFSPDGKTVLVNGIGETSLWEAVTGRKLLDVQSRGEQEPTIDHALWLPDGKTLCTAETLPRIRWDPRKDPVPPPDRDRERYEVRFRDAGTGRLLRSLPLVDDCKHMALSPDGKMLAVSQGKYNEAGKVQLWDLTPGRPLLTFVGHESFIDSLAFSPDGKTLASGSGDTTILLWNVGRARLESLWEKLTTGIDENARLLARAGAPEKAVPALRERLLQRATMEKRINLYLGELDADDFETREKASHSLEELGEIAAPALRQALEGKPSQEARKRIHSILENVKEDAKGPAKANRILLSLALLEEIGAGPAWEVIEELAGAIEETRVRHEARAALDRLRQKDKPERKSP
jgi:WD40 repeat protein